MDFVLAYLDQSCFDRLYDSSRDMLTQSICLQESSIGICATLTDPSTWRRESPHRQALSIFLVLWLSSSLFLLMFGSLCYLCNFDKSLKRHPRYYRNQIWKKARQSLATIFLSGALTVPVLLAQVRGYAKLYDIGDGTVSTIYELAQIPLFFFFNDTCMYWLHRAFHQPFLFNAMHKKHHLFIIPTPFSAYAFDPLEAWIISLLTYAYSFLWPMSRHVQLFIFVCANVWSFLYHDSREQFHTVHHRNTQRNFGQYLSTWDQIAGTYGDHKRYRRGGANARLSSK
ncbi:hypothetical protein BO79DRAFT_217370 [Aspergillus costaricaensis CBS 115574]|uniref:sterol desaturase family protein n=1 Tax=Aspergillus costaricaensis CBS 115574 TaxID=1448317 RepID=UPI000DBCD1BF|nr:hypothetical protein BO79DRAFT_217370 [Aspergillus costaricaensis CBS 115574]RAK89300.1 hypothetical protein BO79DRAFT_217370 [Aspergillus costaricaensis CBS 115574]